MSAKRKQFENTCGTKIFVVILDWCATRFWTCSRRRPRPQALTTARRYPHGSLASTSWVTRNTSKYDAFVPDLLYRELTCCPSHSTSLITANRFRECLRGRSGTLQRLGWDHR
jgi:hypothetical protein